MVRKKRLKKNKQRSMNRRMRGKKGPMSIERKQELKKIREVQRQAMKRIRCEKNIAPTKITGKEGD